MIAAGLLRRDKTERPLAKQVREIVLDVVTMTDVQGNSARFLIEKLPLPEINMADENSPK